VVQIAATESPVERSGGAVVPLLECGDLVGELVETDEVVRGEQLALDDGEVDLVG
jgi:hypothetical protein